MNVNLCSLAQGQTRQAILGAARRPGVLSTFVLVLTATCVGLVSILATPLPAEARAAAAIFPPWWSPARIFEAAGSSGEITRLGAVSFVIIVRSDTPALATRLREAGAILLLDPIQLSLCQSVDLQGAKP